MVYDCCVRQKKCRSILKHVLKRCDNRKSCRRPVVSLSHATKSYRVNRPLQNAANRLYEKTKVGSARRVTRLAGSLFFDGRVTLLAGPTFLHINTLARSAGTQLHVSEIEVRVLSLKRTLWVKLLSKKLNLSQQ